MALCILSVPGSPLSSYRYFDLACLLFQIPRHNINAAKVLSLSTYDSYFSQVAGIPGFSVPQRRAGQLDAGLFCWHASLAYEISESLTRALADESGEPATRTTFYGAYYPTGALDMIRGVLKEGQLAADIARAYNDWIDGFLDDYQMWATPSRISAAFDRLLSLYKTVLQGSTHDILVCVTPLWFCVLLWEALTTPKLDVSKSPSVVVYFDDLADQVPPERFPEAVSTLQQMKTQGATLVAPTALVAALTERLVGQQPLIVPFTCWYVKDAISWNPAAAASSEVFMFRADLWVESTIGRVFFHVLHLFMHKLKGWSPTFRIMGMLRPGHRSMSFQELWSTAATVARAAIFLPDDMQKMIFWEAYALAIPLWTPSLEHLARMLPYFTYYHFSGKHLPNNLTVPIAASGRRFPVEPFGLSAAGEDDSRSLAEKQRAPTQALFWAGLSDFVRYPHVERFTSVPSLLRSLMECDSGCLVAKSAAMKKAHEKHATAARAVWKWAAGRALRADFARA
eukprot:TRINITY_DN69522_c0_g1_i1.p1 TRINITY_DN69522_c0_g1~~TRINITY_DN69522_c0_g1_i1.p1  ORF type:complete len:511 (-),score=45.53 TRINITY_DN69522_c0_g1_i1:446-1978(-)